MTGSLVHTHNKAIMDLPQTIIRRAVAGDAQAATEVLRRSIVDLGIADHCNDPQRLKSWLANKQPEFFLSWLTVKRDLRQ